MDDRHEAARRRLEDAVLSGPAHLDARERGAIAARQGVPEDLRALVEKVAHQAYRVTDEDVAPLRARYGDDPLFEAIVCAALGAARERLQAGLRALETA